MNKKNLLFLFLLVSMNIQSSALHRAWQPVASYARNLCTRAGNSIAKLRSYTPHWTNKNIRPWGNRIVTVVKNRWVKPTLMTGLAAGGGLGTYHMTRSSVYAQENVAPEVRAFLQEAQNIINSLRNELANCTNYTCANLIFNKCENLIGILLHNDYEGVSLQGAHQASVIYLLKDALSVKTEAIAKALDFAKDKIWAMWHTPEKQIYYNQNLITQMLHHIGHYSGALFRYGVYPKGNDWVSIPPIYAHILTAIVKDSTLKQQFMHELNNYRSAVLQDDNKAMSRALLAIINAVQSSLNV